MSKLQQKMRSRGIPASALGGGGDASAPLSSSAASLPPPPSYKLEAIMGHSARGEEVELPVVGRVYMKLLGHAAMSEVEAGLFQEIDRLKMPINAMTIPSIDLERKTRILAKSARDPDDHSMPLGTLEHWSDLVDDDVIHSSFLCYDDIRQRLDPLGSSFALTQEKTDELVAYWKKKDIMALMACGTRVLSHFLLSGVFQLSSSQTPSSTSTHSSPDSWEEEESPQGQETRP